MSEKNASAKVVRKNTPTEKVVIKTDIDQATKLAEEDVKAGRVTTYNTVEEFTKKMNEL